MASRERVDNFLAHYASDNYDPAKAREYYLKTRELKGREQNTAGMSEEQKQAWAYTKNKVGTDKKSALASEQASYKARMDGLRNTAKATRDRIKGKLDAFLASVKVERPDRIEAEHVDEPTLIPIPDGIPEKRKAYLQKQNSLRLRKYNREVDAAEEVASVANKAAMEKYGVAREAAATSSKKAREDSKVERERVGTELKAAVANARTSYVEAKKQLIAKYESTTNTEYDNIRSKLPGAPPKAAKATTKSKAAAKSKGEVKGKADVKTKVAATAKPEVPAKAATDPNTMMKSKTARFN